MEWKIQTLGFTCVRSLTLHHFDFRQNHLSPYQKTRTWCRVCRKRRTSQKVGSDGRGKFFSWKVNKRVRFSCLTHPRTVVGFIWSCGSSGSKMKSPLTAMSANLLHQELAPSDFLHQATCITLGIMSNVDAALQNAQCNKLAAAPYEISVCFRVCALCTHLCSLFLRDCCHRQNNADGHFDHTLCRDERTRSHKGWEQKAF